MKWKPLLPLTLALAAMGPTAHASEATIEKMWQDFYVQFAAIVRGGESPKDAPTDIVFSLMHPGLPLETLDQDYVDNLLDRGMKDSPFYKDSNGTVTMAWSKIIHDRIFDPTPPPAVKGMPTEDQLMAAEKILDPEQTPGYQKYLDKQAAYLNCVTAQNKCEDDAEIDKLTADTTNALAAWNATKRNIYTDAMAKLAMANSMSPSYYWNNLITFSTKFQKKGVYRCLVFPTWKDWTSDNGWTEFSYKKTSKRETTSFNNTDVTASANIKVKLFKANASAEYSNNLAETLSTDDTFSLTLKFKRVIITRPWLDWSVFSSKRWWFNDASIVISDNEKANSKALIPVVPQYLILVKDVKFKSKKLAEFFKDKKSSLNTKGGASYGPFFSAKATYTKDTGKTETGEDTELGVVKIIGVQIAAVVGVRVPPCPVQPPQ